MTILLPGKEKIAPFEIELPEGLVLTDDIKVGCTPIYGYRPALPEKVVPLSGRMRWTWALDRNQRPMILDGVIIRIKDKAKQFDLDPSPFMTDADTVNIEATASDFGDIKWH